MSACQAIEDAVTLISLLSAVSTGAMTGTTCAEAVDDDHAGAPARAGEPPDVLRAKVTSPNGTTAAKGDLVVSGATTREMPTPKARLAGRTSTTMLAALVAR